MLNSIVEPPHKGETKFIFFSGKGGVGKSTMSCATAVYLARKGYRTLLVTTDPAPNLSDIFRQPIGNNITSIKDIENLSAVEIDPDAASEAYRERAIAPMRELLDEKSLETIKEQMKSPCVEEVAAFDKFIDFMCQPRYDVVIFDTAPTGHTIRLLELPGGWSDEISKGGATCIGPSSSLAGSKERYDEALSYLRDATKTSFVFVLKPERLSLIETKRSTEELSKLGVKTSLLIVNGVLPDEAVTDTFFERVKQEEDNELSHISEAFKGIEIVLYPLNDSEVNGLPSLEAVGAYLFEGKRENPVKILGPTSVEFHPGDDWEAIDRIFTPANGTRYLFFTGKGGVGKSTIACAASVYMASRGFKTLIVTTDPASHLQYIFEQPVGSEPMPIEGIDGLYAVRIDQKRSLELYKQRILESVRDKDESTRKSVEEDLTSPCAEEMAAFEKFMSFFDLPGYDVIIFDTAPTGHTLRLLELPVDWKGFIDIGTLTKETSETSKSYEHVIETMRDRDKSSFIFVLYPEYTPIMEAWRSANDLKKQVGIETACVVVNYLLPAGYGDNAFFNRRRAQQQKYLKDIRDRFKVPMLLVPLLEKEPEGINGLLDLDKKIFKGKIMGSREIKHDIG
jgi:arsenite/tail-anchored protein-transporting ATPase